MKLKIIVILKNFIGHKYIFCEIESAELDFKNNFVKTPLECKMIRPLIRD